MVKHIFAIVGAHLSLAYNVAVVVTEVGLEALGPAHVVRVACGVFVRAHNYHVVAGAHVVKALWVFKHALIYLNVVRPFNSYKVGHRRALVVGINLDTLRASAGVLISVGDIIGAAVFGYRPTVFTRI